MTMLVPSRRLASLAGLVAAVAVLVPFAAGAAGGAAPPALSPMSVGGTGEAVSDYPFSNGHIPTPKQAVPSRRTMGDAAYAAAKAAARRTAVQREAAAATAAPGRVATTVNSINEGPNQS